MRTSRGVDKGSVAMYWLRQVHPVSAGIFSHEKLITAIIRLYMSVVAHSFLWGVSQATGRSIIVGNKTFSIVGG